MPEPFDLHHREPERDRVEDECRQGERRGSLDRSGVHAVLDDGFTARAARDRTISDQRETMHKPTTMAGGELIRWNRHSVIIRIVHSQVLCAE